MLVSRILKLKKLQSENAILRKKISRQYRHRDIITKNPRMEEILALTREICEHPQHRADLRRQRNREGTGGARHSLLRGPRGEAVCERELRRADGNAAGERIVRP